MGEAGHAAAAQRQAFHQVLQPAGDYKNPAAKALPVTYVAFVPKDKSTDERAKTDKSWQRAVARGWTIRTFPGTHVPWWRIRAVSRRSSSNR